MPTATEAFSDFFLKATGNSPYAYQRALGESDTPPAVLEVPTGAGKTQALIVSWLYGRRVRGTAPRRLVYALPMRSLVEQTASVAHQIRDCLDLDDQALPIHTLMGGVERSALRDWRDWPERDQILIGTIDMLLSRALNRGYGEGRYQWPVAFGLLNNDCRWVFDEVQLMQSARTTAAQLDGLRAKLGVALPCETIWASATVDRKALRTIDRPELGPVLQLPVEDRERDGPLKESLNATKLLERVDLTSHKTGAVARAIAERVTERHRPGTRSIIVLNRVELAQEVTHQLERHLATDVKDSLAPEVMLLHSRYRPLDRKEHMNAALAAVDNGAGRIVVATQVIEAGIDISSALLATETAPFSSIVQRLGRCNRKGEDGEATVLWLDRGEPDAKQAAPYAPEDITAARTALLGLVGQSLSPSALEGLDVPERREAWDVLRRHDLLDLFDTSPDLSGMDVDVARFIRDDDERSVFVFFRDLTGLDAKAINAQSPAEPDELVSVPQHSLDGRAARIYDPIDDAWRLVRRPSPGSTVMLATADGGYDTKLGWKPDIKTPVTSLVSAEPPACEPFDGNERTHAGEWISLADHLDQTKDRASELIDVLGAIEGRIDCGQAVIDAAALHDIGKAHPAFQEMLRSTVDPENEPDAFDTTLWAKSGRNRGKRNERRHFRHELASAMGLRSYDGNLMLPQDTRDLVEYLVAAHHGRVRLSIRPAPEEQPPADDRDRRFALGVHEGDQLPPVQTPVGSLPDVTLDLACMELGGTEHSWVEAACGLRDDPQLGPFRLGFLEALVRIVDWKASG